MNIPLKVVVRLWSDPSTTADNNKQCTRTTTTTSSSNDDPQQEESDPDTQLTTAEGRTFRFSHVFRTPPIGNQELYFESVAGLMESVLEGYDFSIVTYGAKGTGKTFTLYGGSNGPGSPEDDCGIVLCFVRDLFCRLNAHPERMFSISIAWSEISAGGDVIDVLENAAMVQCFSVEDTYALLGLGLHQRNGENHSILSLVLEQQWTSVGGLNQHRQSTISFCDLRGSEREKGDLQPLDTGLRKLEDIVVRRNEQYNDSVLTAFLKDSFGGRAQTLLLLCVAASSLETESTARDLEFGERAEEIVNHVVMNTFSDNNVPIVGLTEHDPLGAPNGNMDGLYFASQQWSKLLKNAECLFTKLFSTCELNQTERNQIEEWLYLKAECDDCFSSTDISIPTGTQHTTRACLGPIEEIDEAEDGTTVHGSGKEAYQSDNESDSDICTHLTDVSDRIQSYMKTFQAKTNNLIMEKYQEFFQTHPTGMGSTLEPEEQERKVQPSEGSNFHNPARRKSIFDSETVSSTELTLMLPLKSESLPAAPTALDKKLDTLNSNLRICQTGIESLHAQIEEIRRTIALKQKYITDLIENSETRSVAKSRFSKKKHKLEAEYEKAKKQLRKAVVNGTNKEEINRLKSQTSQLEQRLKDLETIGFIAGESGHKKKKLQQSIKDSQKQFDVLQRMLKKELDRKETLEKELETVQREAKVARQSNGVGVGGALQELNESKSKIRNMNERISHIEHVLKEKSSNLKKYVNKKSAEKESLRCEIRNLRRTRDHLVEQRCQLDRKIREDKIPSFDEERKLVECDEAIEAIDAAIEMKNELICGRKSIDTDESLQREKGEQMLMARLNKLSLDEMRTLLYKYFQKVVDLKEASRKLELQFISLEREKDAWEWQEKILTNTIRQTRLEKERSIVALQKQHETKLNLMLRHFAADTSASISSTIPDNALPPYHTQTEFVLGSGSTRYHHHHHVQYESDGGGGTTTTSGGTEPAILSGHSSKQLAHYKANTLPVAGAIAHSSNSALTHHRTGGTVAVVAASQQQPPLGVLGEKEHRPKSKLFSKLQVLSRYHGSDKRKIFQSDIPQQNLKQLQGASRPSLTKVTREKNKIIIQSDGGSK
uniref:Kinesin motor domain-containing protein n=1 Tax=Anopheles christyi TaxID=43041 RepID=A0A182JW19_9DIPT